MQGMCNRTILQQGGILLNRKNNTLASSLKYFNNQKQKHKRAHTHGHTLKTQTLQLNYI